MTVPCAEWYPIRCLSRYPRFQYWCLHLRHTTYQYRNQFWVPLHIAFCSQHLHWQKMHYYSLVHRCCYSSSLFRDHLSLTSILLLILYNTIYRATHYFFSGSFVCFSEASLCILSCVSRKASLMSGVYSPSLIQIWAIHFSSTATLKGRRWCWIKSDWDKIWSSDPNNIKWQMANICQNCSMITIY